MKSTGVVRKVDELGRIVIPVELRRNLEINEKDALEIFVEGEEIILKKYNPGCHCCKNVKIATNIQGIALCSDCVLKFKRAIKIIEGSEGVR